MTASTNGKNGVKPAYEDKVPVANKITFFAMTEREKTILMQPFVGKAGRDKDMAIIEFAEKLEKTEGATEMIKLKNLAQEDSFYDVIALALGMDEPADRKWLDENLHLMGWFDAFKGAVDYRMSGSVWRPDVQEALGKSTAGIGAPEPATNLP